MNAKREYMIEGYAWAIAVPLLIYSYWRFLRASEARSAARSIVIYSLTNIIPAFEKAGFEKCRHIADMGSGSSLATSMMLADGRSLDDIKAPNADEEITFHAIVEVSPNSAFIQVSAFHMPQDGANRELCVEAPWFIDAEDLLRVFKAQFSPWMASGDSQTVFYVPMTGLWATQGYLDFASPLDPGFKTLKRMHQQPSHKRYPLTAQFA